MENVNGNASPSQGGGLAAAKALFADYKKQGDNGGNKKMSKEELFAKYFTPRKEKEVFRILPPKGAQKHIQTAFFHVVNEKTAGGKRRYRKIYCPKHNDPQVAKKDANGEVVTGSNGQPFMVSAPCPLCSKSDNMLSTQDNSIKGIKKENLTPDQRKVWDRNRDIFIEAKKLEAKKFYIVKGIDKGNTGDGVKFWRFKHNHQKQGDHDKLIPALQMFVEQYNVDFADPLKGTDLIISVVDNQMPNGKPFKKVSNIMPKGSSPLAEDELIRSQWIEDETTWRDVFKPATAPEMTPHEYLERLTTDTNPYWDDSDPDNKHWVYPDPKDADKQAKANNKDRSLGSNSGNKNVEQASDLVTKSYDSTTIENVTKDDVGEYKDDAEDLSSTPTSKNETVSSNVEESYETADVDSDDDGDFDDLPF